MFALFSLPFWGVGAHLGRSAASAALETTRLFIVPEVVASSPASGAGSSPGSGGSEGDNGGGSGGGGSGLRVSVNRVGGSGGRFYVSWQGGAG